MTSLCRRLVTEFMHYVIEAKALRKVFCSIKGYYFQAEIKVDKFIYLMRLSSNVDIPQGQPVTWVIPHNFGFVQPAAPTSDWLIPSTIHHPSRWQPLRPDSIIISSLVLTCCHSSNTIMPV